ncbi:periplasmic nitrate reductase, NapE protein [Billgrantia zhangzhouensis]
MTIASYGSTRRHAAVLPMDHSIEKTRRPQKPNTPEETREKRRELAVFIFLAGVLFPILAVIVVSGYGFLVWMLQLLTGPPGPPE